mgnify:FL=1
MRSAKLSRPTVGRLVAVRSVPVPFVHCADRSTVGGADAPWKWKQEEEIDMLTTPFAMARGERLDSRPRLVVHIDVPC